MRISPVLASLTFSLLAACGGSGGTTNGPATPTATATTDRHPSCPMAVPGTSVTVEDTDTGAALVFVTTGDAAEVRRRVGNIAEMHNKHHGSMGPLPTGNETGDGHDHASHGGPDMAGSHGAHHAGGAQGRHSGHAGGMIGVHSAASAEEIDGGARLALVVAPADVAKLQEQLRAHAQQMSGGSCEMSHH